MILRLIGTALVIAASAAVMPAAIAQNVSSASHPPSTSPDDYAGYFQLASHVVLKVWREDDRWFIQLTHQ